jgi:hypothetical protein
VWFIESSQANQAAAKTACEAAGGRLAVVDSAEKQTAAANVRASGWAGWIAGTAAAGDGVWSWQYGQAWDYTY